MVVRRQKARAVLVSPHSLARKALIESSIYKVAFTESSLPASGGAAARHVVREDAVHARQLCASELEEGSTYSLTLDCVTALTTSGVSTRA